LGKILAQAGQSRGAKVKGENLLDAGFDP